MSVHRPQPQGSSTLRDLREVLGARHLPTLDGLRAVSVLLVIGGHFGLGARADLGVDTFFVLSGFLITWLLLKEHAATGDISLKRFYLRRTLRIFPAYYAFLAAAISWDLYRGDTRILPAIGPGVTYLMNYYNALNGHPQNSINHAWSLANEEQFYILWPGLFLLLMRRSLTTRLVAVASFIVAVMVWRTTAYGVLGLGASYAYNAFDARADNLAVGCLLALATHSTWFPAVARQLVRWWFLPVIVVLLLAMSPWDALPLLHYGPGFTLNAVLIAILIVQLLQVHRARSWRWLEHPVVRYVGLVSYPMYLYHGYGLGLAKRLEGLPQVGQLLIAVSSTVAIASVSYFAIEKPFLRLKAHLETKTAVSGPEPAAPVRVGAVPPGSS